MASPGLQNRLGTVFNFGVVGNLSDGQLIELFLTAEDGADQVAFSALVERHGPIVLGVCRQVLGKSHDAEDAFQATFLILARKAGSLRAPDSLANWLRGVALRVARQARASAARRSDYERRGASLKLVAAESTDSQAYSLPELHEAIARLPAHYRQPVVLCYLEGLSTEEAALKIGCSKGTVYSRLFRARERLRERLDRSDLAMPAALGAADQTSRATNTLPALLLNTTVRASLEFAGRQPAGTALASATVTTLTREVLYSMMISKLIVMGAAVLASALAVGSVLSFRHLGSGNRRQELATAAPAEGDPQAALARPVDKLESGLDEAARRNAAVERKLQGIRSILGAPRAASRPISVDGPVIQLDASHKRNPQPPASMDLAAAQEETKRSAWLHGTYFREMSAYDFYLDAEERQKLVMRREPVLRYPAPPEECWGEIYICTDHGRAAVVGCVFGGPGEKSTHRIFHEFHSLNPKPLVAVGGATGWQSKEPGLRFEPVPDAPEPDKDKARRLTQMWVIARRFNASENWNNANIEELRFLPQPLYRYELPNKESSVVDGALFAYVHDEIDDPEVLILIEAQRMGNEVRWHYALVSLTDREAWVRFQGKEVWRAAASSVGVFDGVTGKRYGVFFVKTIHHAGDEK